MSRAPLARVEAWTDVACNGGVRSGILAHRRQTALRGLLSCGASLRTDGKDTLTVVAPGSNDGLGALTLGGALRLTFTSGAAVEWRIESIVTARAEDGSEKVTVTARALLLDLANILVRTYETNGTSHVDFTLPQVTIAEVLADVVAPLLSEDGYGWIGLGAIDDGTLYDPEWTGLTALQLVDYLCGLRASGPLEARLRPVGWTSYALDLLVGINAAAPSPEVRLKKNLRTYARTRTTEGMATAVAALGSTRPDGLVAGLGGIMLRVDTVDVPTSSVTLVDPTDGTAAVRVDGVLDGMALVATATTGQVVPILASAAMDARVTLGGVAGRYAGEPMLLAAGPGTGRAYPDMPFGYLPVGVASVNGNTIGLTDPFGTTTFHQGGVAAYVNRWRGLNIASGPAVGVYSLTWGYAASQQYALNNVVGIAVGDVGVATYYQTGSNLSAFSAGFTVAAVDAASNRITVAPRYRPGVPVITGTGMLYQYVHIYRFTDRSSVVSSANEAIVLTDATGIALGHWMDAWIPATYPEPVQLLAPAARPGAELRQHRLGIARYEATDEANLLGNGYLSYWPDPDAVNPVGLFNRYDQYLASGGAGTTYRPGGRRNTTDASKIITGDKSLRLRQTRVTSLGEAVSTGGSAFWTNGSGGPSLVDFLAGESIGCGQPATEIITVATVTYNATTSPPRWEYTTRAPFTADHVMGTYLYGVGAQNTHRFAMPPCGVVTAWATLWMEGPPGTPEVCGVLSLTKPGVAAQSVTTTVQDEWQSVAIVGFQAPPGSPVDLEIGINGGAYNYSLWVDRIGVSPTTYEPDPNPDYSNGLPLYEAAQRFLAERSGGMDLYDMTFLDLTRLDAAAWPDDELLVGATARVRDPQTGAVVPLRMLELRPDYLKEADTGVTLATSPFTLTSQVA